MARGTLYSVVYVAGTTVVGLGIALGFYHSLTADHTLPQVSLDDVVGSYLDEVDGLMEQGQHDRAIEELELILKLLPRERELTHDRLGRAFMAQDQLDQAARHFARALAIDPDFAEAHHDLGVVYARQGRLDQAVAAVRQALRLRPDYPAARENLGRMEARLAPTVAAAGEDEPLLVRGRDVVRRFHRGELESLHAEWSAGLAAKMSLEQLTELHAQTRRQLGPEQELLDERLLPLADSSMLYRRRARFERHDGEVEVLVQFRDGAIDGLMFRPVEP